MNRNFFILISLICLGCSSVNSNTQRVTPSPIAATPTPVPSVFVAPSGNLSDDFPDPLKTPEVKIEDLTFDVTIEFDGILGRVSVDNGRIENAPAFYKLKGGTHKIEVFDLITKCRIADVYYIDKNQTIDLRKKCNL